MNNTRLETVNRQRGGRRWRAAGILAALFFSAALIPSLLASESSKVKSIEKNAVLRLENGALVRLAGLELPDESVPLLGVLLGGKEVEVAADTRGQEPSQDAPKASYLYVNTSEIDVPFAEAVPAREKKIMINELLVAIGAARVLHHAEFDQKEMFLKLEDKARQDGQGLWSYEVIPADAPVANPV